MPQGSQVIMELVNKGGPVMYPIIGASIVALGVFLARLYTLRSQNVIPPRLMREVEQHVRARELTRALELCAPGRSTLERVWHQALRYSSEPRPQLKARLEELGRRELQRLERYIGIVGIVASIEPLLGLLGTVTGMIAVFQGIVVNGVGDPAVLAGGIWEALITTAAGLITAIPALLGWKYLVARVDAIGLQLEEDTSRLVDVLTGADPSPSGQVTATGPESPLVLESAS